MTIAALILAAGTASRYRAADPTVATKLVARLDGVPRPSAMRELLDAVAKGVR